MYVYDMGDKVGLELVIGISVLYFSDIADFIGLATNVCHYNYILFGLKRPQIYTASAC